MTRENTASFWRCCGTAQGITSERTTFLNSAIRNSQHQQTPETSRGKNVLFPRKDRKHRLSYKKQPSLKSPLFSFFKTWFSKIVFFFSAFLTKTQTAASPLPSAGSPVEGLQLMDCCPFPRSVHVQEPQWTRFSEGTICCKLRLTSGQHRLQENKFCTYTVLRPTAKPHPLIGSTVT